MEESTFVAQRRRPQAKGTKTLEPEPVVLCLRLTGKVIFESY